MCVDDDAAAVAAAAVFICFYLFYVWAMHSIIYPPIVILISNGLAACRKT